MGSSKLCRHQQYIGKVKHAVFHTQKAARKRVVVSTEENVISSLDLRHGEICECFFNSKVLALEVMAVTHCAMSYNASVRVIF